MLVAKCSLLLLHLHLQRRDLQLELMVVVVDLARSEIHLFEMAQGVGSVRIVEAGTAATGWPCCSSTLTEVLLQLDVSPFQLLQLRRKPSHLSLSRLLVSQGLLESFLQHLVGL